MPDSRFVLIAFYLTCQMGEGGCVMEGEVMLYAAWICASLRVQSHGRGIHPTATLRPTCQALLLTWLCSMDSGEEQSCR